MKKITNFIIDTSDLIGTAGSSREIIVIGEKDAEFMLQIYDTDGDFYDFTSKSFGSEFISSNNLRVKMDKETYIRNIDFPRKAIGDTYTILLLVPPDKNTELTFGSGKYSHNTSIVQRANQTITFQASSIGKGDSYILPTAVESNGSPTTISGVIETINWDIKNTDDDDDGFGLRLTRQPIDTDWFYNSPTGTVVRESSNTDTVNGATSGSTSVTMDTSYITTGISAGDYVYGSGVTDGTTIVAVNVGDNPLVITLSAAMSISDEVILTFIAPTNEVVVAELTNLCVGMYITAVNTGNLTGEPIILDIDIPTKKLTLSSEQAFANGINLTFQARGSSVIKESSGVDIDLSNWNSDVTSATSTELTKRIRAVGGGTTVRLDNTHGISGGGFVTIAGVGVVNTSANTVQTVTTDHDGDGGDGAAVMQVAQGFKAGSKIYFTGSTKTVVIANTIKVRSYPVRGISIYLNLDNFITPGVSGL